MAANYLHGVETIEVESGAVPIRVVKSAVIGIVGTAPKGVLNKPVLITNNDDIVSFGKDFDGFTIPQALSVISSYGSGTVVVINVFDPVKHKSTIENEAITVASGGLIALAHPVVSDVVVKNADASTTYTEGTDYSVDLDNGILRILAGSTITNAQQVSVSYSYGDVSKVTSDDINGGLDDAANRTGMRAFEDCYNLFGFDVKILVSPGYSQLASVSTQLSALANKLGGMAYIDAPIGTTLAQVIAGRGPEGTINFNTSSDRVRLCYPHVLGPKSTVDKPSLIPLSIHAAALRAKTDYSKGYWWSSSNQELVGVVGLERNLTARIDSPDSEVNLLNEVGITTVFNSFGTGFRLWGNRSAAWPSVTAMKNFENVRRTADVINESIRFSSLQFIDRPINQALIDSIVESVNAFGRKLIGDGALIGFSAWYDAARNPKEELALGHVLISYKFTVPPPAERISYESTITDEFLVNLKGGN